MKNLKSAFKIFGNKPVGQRNIHENDGYYTGNSSSVHGVVTIDPSIRAIQEQGLSRINNLYNQTGAYGEELLNNSRGLRTAANNRYSKLLSNNSGLRERYIGNQSAYANAQLNPLRQQIATGRGDLQKNIGLRGISGSSFGNQAMTSYDLETQRGLQDASANVENQQLQALQGIDAQRGQFVSQELQAKTGIDSTMAQNMFGTIAQQAQLNGESQDIARQRLGQELAALGLGADQIKQMQDSYDRFLNRDLERRRMFSQGLSNTFNTTMGGMGSSGGPR